MSHTPLQDKIALVTGASRGLGLEIARQLALAGAHVALAARDAKALATASEQVREACAVPSQRIVSFTTDLAHDEMADALVAEVERAMGQVDILINNAAIQGPIGAFEQADWGAWRDVFQVDFLAPARLIRGVIPAMRRRGWGKIINLSGGGATGPRPDVSAYACAKTALMRLTETVAEELKGSGIDINAVAPGAMNTRMLEETLAAGPQGAKREYDAALARSRSGGAAPAKAAELILFLASPISDGITGRLISAVWDDWKGLPEHREELTKTDVYTLRRIIPRDRGMAW